jgi:hypothetical protein
MRFACVLIVLAACGSHKHKGDDGPDTDALVDCDAEGTHRCMGSTYQTCNAGLWQTAVDCPLQCVDAFGCVQCSPGQTFCKDGNVWSCDDSGNPGAEVQVCGGQTTCIGGACADACLDAEASKSYIGCEYWAVDLDNAVEVWGGSGGSCTQGTPMTLNVCYAMQMGGIYAGQCDPQDDGTAPHTCPGGTTCQPRLVCASDAQRGPFAVVISNPQAKDVNVEVTGPNGAVINRTIMAGQVAPILLQTGGTIPDQSVDGSGKFRKAYKITSDLPVVAYQFNPLDNANVFSNDGSLLIPRTTFDTDYYAMTMATLDRRPNKDAYYGYLTIVAWQDNTQIAVTPTAAVMPSQTQNAIAAGATANFTLNAFEVLQLQARAGTSADLTGTHVTSPNMMSFGVFGGHEATAFGDTTPPDMQHNQGPGYADHLEEMLFPSTTWGKTFAIARSQPRSNETDLVRVLAQKAGTMITITPAPAAGACATLSAGQFCEFKIAGDTEIASNEPILVGHFLQSATWRANNGTTVGTGDPSMALSVPVEQFRKDYTILVPAQYAMNYVSIAAAQTGGVTLDGAAVTLTPFSGGGTHRAARLPLVAGQHKITCADGCGITVYGYSPGVSYMFAGGLDLKPIVIL